MVALTNHPTNDLTAVNLLGVLRALTQACCFAAINSNA